jgi:multiple sugar transport system substrate-binding protein
MKHVFLGVAVGFAILAVAATATLDHPPNDGITHMRWATDANPARNVQTGLFDDMYLPLRADVAVDPGLGGDQTKLIVQCATGTGPDIVDVYSKEQMMSLVEAGILLDVTPYAAAMGFSPDRTYPALDHGITVDGRQYRFPCNVWANCMVYNKAVLDDHNCPYPEDGWTWEDFVELGKRFEANGSKSGEDHIYFANLNKLWLYGDMLFNAGGRYFTEDGLASEFDSDESIEAMQLYYDLMYKYHVVPTAAELNSMTAQGGWGSGALTLFSTGKAAMMEIGRWYIIQVPNYPQIAGVLGAVRLPRVGDNPPTGLSDARAAGINLRGPHMPREGDSPERIAELTIPIEDVRVGDGPLPEGTPDRVPRPLLFLQYLASEEYSECIVNDGDSLPPNPKLASDGEALVNQTIPDPAFHQPFVDAIRDAKPIDTSPFIDALVVQRWLTEAVDGVENQVKRDGVEVGPEQTMRNLAHEIRQTIRRNLERRPDLQRKYEEVTGKPYTPDWWRDHPAYQRGGE